MDDAVRGKWSWGTTDEPPVRDEPPVDDAPSAVPDGERAGDAVADEPPTEAVVAPPVDEPVYEMEGGDGEGVVHDADADADTDTDTDADADTDTDTDTDADTASPAASLGERRRRRGGILGVALVAALVGAAAGGGVATLVDDDDPTTVVRYGANSAPIGQPKDIQGILAKVQPGVVSIRTSSFQGGDLFGNQPVRGAGTGMIISPDGDVLTNAHVVNGATSIKVTLFGETEARDADLLGSNPASDVAVVKIRNASNLPTVQLGDSSRIQVGDSVVAIGNALALPGGPSVTQGIVSAKDRSIDADDVQLGSLIQTDAAINPGNSGGPLVNSDGEVIGMNTAIRGDAQNIGFAIAVNTVKPQIDALRRGGGSVTSRAFLGVNAQTLTPEMREQFDFEAEEGAVVVDTTAGSPAENGGLLRGDVITSFDGTKITTAEGLVAAVQAKKPGDRVEIVYQRGERERRVTVTLGSRQVGGG